MFLSVFALVSTVNAFNLEDFKKNHQGVITNVDNIATNNQTAINNATTVVEVHNVINGVLPATAPINVATEGPIVAPVVSDMEARLPDVLDIISTEFPSGYNLAQISNAFSAIRMVSAEPITADNAGAVHASFLPYTTEYNKYKDKLLPILHGIGNADPNYEVFAKKFPIFAEFLKTAKTYAPGAGLTAGSFAAGLHTFLNAALPAATLRASYAQTAFDLMFMLKTDAQNVANPLCDAASLVRIQNANAGDAARAGIVSGQIAINDAFLVNLGYAGAHIDNLKIPANTVLPIFSVVGSKNLYWGIDLPGLLTQKDELICPRINLVANAVAAFDNTTEVLFPSDAVNVSAAFDVNNAANPDRVQNDIHADVAIKYYLRGANVGTLALTTANAVHSLRHAANVAGGGINANAILVYEFGLTDSGAGVALTIAHLSAANAPDAIMAPHGFAIATGANAFGVAGVQVDAIAAGSPLDKTMRERITKQKFAA